MADETDVEEAEPEFGYDEGEEEELHKKPRKGRRDEAKEQEKYIRLLKKYVDSMAYANLPKFPPKDTDRTERLAKPKKLHLKESKKTRVIAVEDLQRKIEAHEKREATKLKAKRRRKRLYHSVIEKLKKQWHEHFMKIVIKKFADYMAKATINYKNKSMSTEGRQRLIRGLVCNMYLAMNITKPPCSMEQNVFETMGYILSDLILETLFAAQNKDEETPIPEPEIIRKKCEPRVKKPKLFKKKHPWSLKPKKGIKRKKPVMLPKLPEEFKCMIELFIKRNINQCRERQKGDSRQTSLKTK